MRTMLVLLGLFVGACGGGDRAGGSGAPGADLRVTIWPEGRGGAAVTATLTCEPPGGDHPDPEAACRALSRHLDALDPVPADAICTQVYGGADEARVEGTLDGRRIDASFDRRNGCEIARWERLAPLLELESR